MPQWGVVYSDGEYKPSCLVMTNSDGTVTEVRFQYQQYRPIPDFPDYVINDRGDIINIWTGNHMSARISATHRWPTVKLRKERKRGAKQYERSLKSLCLKAFPDRTASITEFFNDWVNNIQLNKELKRVGFDVRKYMEES